MCLAIESFINITGDMFLDVSRSYPASHQDGLLSVDFEEWNCIPHDYSPLDAVKVNIEEGDRGVMVCARNRRPNLRR